jgi:serine/threonine-protein kinase PknG
MTACDRPGCTGEIAATGFCDYCGRRALPPSTAFSSPGAAVTSVGPSASTGRSRFSSGFELLDLPEFSFPEPAQRVVGAPADWDVDRDRRCTRCHQNLGSAGSGRPRRSRGFCRRCGHAYSFLPSLHEGELVAGQYEVVGCLDRGGLGWVYLASDHHLDGNFVVLKGLIDVGDAALAVAERRALTMMDHPNIVRIFNFVAHPDRDTGEVREYIVMEYVDGLTLRDVKQQTVDGGTPLQEPLRVEHVIVCGLQILAAFEYLHGRGLLYCDMKPQNVILRPGRRHEQANRIKVIDLGAVRRIGDRTGKVIGTPPFQVSVEEIDERGLTVQSDIHTLGVTLRQLYQVTQDWRDRRLKAMARIRQGLESFDLLIARATHPDPNRRFASATEMADQLRGTHREISSLRDGEGRPGTSSVFAPTAALLDGGLGTVPALDRWERDAGSPEVALDHGRPEVAVAAVRLPTPHLDPRDPAASVLSAAGEMAPRALLGKLSDNVPDSAEVQLARCRAYLALGNQEAATKCARRAGELARGAVDLEWRIRWHDGLTALAEADVQRAEPMFGEVYQAVPGEAAPKLALGYCAELRDDLDRAEAYYQAVWKRDRLDVSAAFGLARIRLAQGDRGGAVDVLDGVPAISRHADAAGIAVVMILVARLGEEHAGAADLTEAARRLAGLYLDGGAEHGEARVRLTTVIREAAFEWARHNHDVLQTDDVLVFGDRPDVGGLRILLERSYRELARQARDADAHGTLIDRANAIRPLTLL